MGATAAERLAQDLKRVVADTQQLLHETADTVGGAAAEARTRAERSLRKANGALERSEREIAHGVRSATRTTDRYVHDKPWQAMGICAGVGLLIGYWLGQR